MDEVNVKGIYKDATVSDAFIKHCFNIFALYNQLTDQYGDNLNFLSKSDQASFEDFPKPFPDAYLTLQTKGETKHFFVDVLSNDAHLLIEASKKIKRYFDYRQGGNWATSDSGFPAVLFVCNSESDCQKVQRRCEIVLNKAWVGDVEFRVTTSDTVELN